MSMPPWLNHPGIQELLHYIVDRLDHVESQGKELTRSVKLDAKSFPALYKAKLEMTKEEMWGYVEGLANLGWIRVRHDRGQMGEARYELRPRIDILNITAIRAAANRPERIKSVSELWREAVYAGLEGTEEMRQAATRCRIDIPGRTPAEIVNQINKLKALLDEPLMLREVSARLFWGASKVLDGRAALVTTLLDVDECPFPEIPVHLQVYLPKKGFDGILFIENQTTFERAIRDESPRFNGLALVFASGFKGSARRLRTTSGTSIFFSEYGSLDAPVRGKFLGWLRSDEVMPCWFWGDLDYSGMEILRVLRQSIPNAAAWVNGYEPMLLELKKGGGHLPQEAGKNFQRTVHQIGCVYADQKLVPELVATGRFVDQELV